MKRFTKFSAALLVLCMIASLVSAAFAAEYEVEPGKTVNVVFEIKNITGIDGEITLDDPNGIVASSKVSKAETTLSGGAEGNKLIYSVLVDLTPTTFKLTYEVKLKASAMDGESCKVTFKYRTSDADFNLSDWIEQTQTVEVKEPVVTEPTPTEPKPTEPRPTEPKPTEPKPTEPTPTEPAVKVDYAKLKEQINIAGGLNPADYTKESWAKVEDALAKAKQALGSKDQKTVDAAMAELRDAIAALVKIDYSALEKAIRDVEEFLGENTVGGKAQELLNALKAAKELLTSGDQKAVDEGAALLVRLLGELEKAIQDLTKIEEIIKEIEKIVEVEVEPSDPYCNISMHYVWPILFFVSLFVNAVFIGLIVFYFVRRKKERDDTPLVDYDIDEDNVST